MSAAENIAKELQKAIERLGPEHGTQDLTERHDADRAAELGLLIHVAEELLAAGIIEAPQTTGPQGKLSFATGEGVPAAIDRVQDEMAAARAKRQGHAL